MKWMLGGRGPDRWRWETPVMRLRAETCRERGDEGSIDLICIYISLPFALSLSPSKLFRQIEGEKEGGQERKEQITRRRN